MKRTAFFIGCLGLMSVSLLAQRSQEGLASYYNDKFHGRQTAYGEIYSKFDFTAASKTFGHNDIVKVIRQDNQKEVIVRINDVGPHKAGRVIDLSRAAAEHIGLIRDGLTSVKVVLVEKGFNGTPPDKTPTSQARKGSTNGTLVIDDSPATPSGRFAVQMGAFGSLENAQQFREGLYDDGYRPIQVVKVKSGGRTIHRVVLGPFANQSKAEKVQMQTRAKGRDCLIIRLDQ